VSESQTGTKAELHLLALIARHAAPKRQRAGALLDTDVMIVPRPELMTSPPTVVPVPCAAPHSPRR